MSRLLIRGGNRLQGEVTIQGAKNSVLPILAATILTGGSVELRRCPRLRDVEASIRILQALGCKAGWRGDVLEVDTAGMTGSDVPDALMREMRSSVIFLGAILARCGEASLTSPGGCELGPRPIDLHLSGLRALGAEIDDTGGALHCKAAKLTGREIVLGFPSVGATENLMLAACGAEGVTVLSNAAREPEIEDLQGFLNTCGAEITGAGTSTVVIRGGRPLHGGTYTILPDRIAAATYLCGAASAGGEVFLRDAREEHLSAVTAVLREAGCDVTGGSAGIVCRRTGRLTAPRPIRTAPYPGFPTDAQAILMAALLRCLRRQYAPEMPVEQLRAIGLTVGSDMPFCVSGGTALAEGRGERLTALPALPDCWIVLCKPEFGIPTPALFTLADAGTPKNRPDIDGMIRALSAGDLGGVAARLCNVFEEFLPEEYHEVFHIKNRLLELGALNAAMSGSGPTVFGIFREETAAKAAETALKQCYPQTYLAKPVGKLV